MAVYGKPQIKKPKTGINVYEDGSYGKPYKGEKANDNSSPGVREFQREIKVRTEKREMNDYKVSAMKEKLAKKKMQ